MSEMAPKRLAEGFTSVEAGVDTNTSPHLLPPNQLANGINLTVRNAAPEQRPGFIKHELNFPGREESDIFDDGLFQVAKCYEADMGFNSIIAMISGEIFRIVPDDGFKVQLITPSTGRNPNNRFDGYMEQAANYMIIQDGLSRPIIFNGASSRRSNPDEIKTGTVMRYCQGRIAYSLPDGFSFRVTDLIGSQASGTAANKYRDAVLKETENTFLNEGGDFSVPGNSGGIRAMAVPAMLDTSMGQGPLQVFTQNTVFSLNTPIDRTIWKDVTYPIQTVSQISRGAEGDRSTIVHNGDIFYRSLDGIRSFKMARQDYAQWRMTPISIEEILYMRGDQEMLLPYGSAAVFDNRKLDTVSPRYTSHGICHLGLAVLDFNIVSGMRTKLPPVWEGMWTGLRVLQILKGKFYGGERCFMFTLNSSTNAIELWELSTDEQFDNGSTRIQWAFETREFDLGREYERKRLEGADIYMERLIDTVDFSLSFRPDSWPGWVAWKTWQECATFTQCLDTLNGTCPTLGNYQTQYRPRVRITQPPDTCYNKRLMRDCYKMQGRLAITGPAKIHQMRFTFQDIDESPNADCPAGKPCETIDTCSVDNFGYTADITIT